ncbi:aromatic-L-amino-acid decarboxylase [Hyaloraphidium curvatum]|nr:aromatic-L-amino-acid decarboxylase [Hyaloraphidium curvatum]
MATSEHLDGRATLLDELERYIEGAWASFNHPRPAEPTPEGALVAHFSDPLPEAPGDSHAALRDAVAALEASVSPSRPLYLAYIGSSGLEAGVLAAALGAVYDVNLATAAGTAEKLDAQAVRWMAEFIGYPAADGHFTSGGQTSNLTAVLAARERAIPGSRIDGVGGSKAAVYCSDEAHHSNVRAVETAGLGRNAVRRIPIDGSRRMDVAKLKKALARDVASGITPVAVIATSGTTLTGAVDPLNAIADVCAEFGVWLHVDGAYGLPAAATKRAAPLFRGLDRADSVTVDLHKWMGLQKSCSLVMVRDASSLLRAFAHDEKYMLHKPDTVNAVDRTLEYSRPFRALKLWLALRLYGADQYRRWIDRTLDNARLFADSVRAHPSFELLHEPQLSTICFRHICAGSGDVDSFNARLATAVQVDGRVFLAPAVVDGATCMRVCFVNYRTTEEDVRAVLPVIDGIAEGLAGSANGHGA